MIRRLTLGQTLVHSRTLAHSCFLNSGQSLVPGGFVQVKLHAPAHLR
jgi:hypothetical protein